MFLDNFIYDRKEKVDEPACDSGARNYKELFRTRPEGLLDPKIRDEMSDILEIFFN